MIFFHLIISQARGRSFLFLKITYYVKAIPSSSSFYHRRKDRRGKDFKIYSKRRISATVSWINKYQEMITSPVFVIWAARGTG